MHRYNDLRTAAIVTRDVAGESVDVVYDLGFIGVDGRPANTEVALENQAGHRALIRVDYQLPILEEIETGPQNAGTLVVEEGGGGCPMGDWIIGRSKQLFELLGNALEAVDALLIGHDDVFEF
jgi:hypothetical protein